MTVDAQRCDRTASTGCCGQNILSRLTPRLIPSSVLHEQACPRSKEFGCVVYGSMILVRRQRALGPPTCLGLYSDGCSARVVDTVSRHSIFNSRPSSSHSQLVVYRLVARGMTRPGRSRPGGGAVAVVWAETPRCAVCGRDRGLLSLCEYCTRIIRKAIDECGKMQCLRHGHYTPLCMSIVRPSRAHVMCFDRLSAPGDVVFQIPCEGAAAG